MSVLDDTTIFRRIVTGADVEGWCLDLVKRWLSTYLAEVERQHGVPAGTWQRPRAYVVAPSLDKYPEDQLPCILLISVGLAERPLRNGDGRFRTLWQMGLACVCSAATMAETHRMAHHYGAALYALFNQRPSLDGKADGVDWLDYDVGDTIDYDDQRSLAAGIASFTVQVDAAVSAGAGPVTPGDPLTPDTDPWPDWPDAETVDVKVEHHPPPDPLPEEEE